MLLIHTKSIPWCHFSSLYKPNYRRMDQVTTLYGLRFYMEGLFSTFYFSTSSHPSIPDLGRWRCAQDNIPEMRSNQDPCCSWPPYDDQAKMTRPQLDEGGRLSVDPWWTRRLPWGPDHTFKPQNTEGCVVPWGRKLGPLRCGPQQCTDPGESMTEPCPASGGPQTRRRHLMCPWLETRCQQEKKIEQINIKI